MIPESCLTLSPSLGKDWPKPEPLTGVTASLGGPDGGGYLPRGCVDKVDKDPKYTQEERNRVCSNFLVGNFPQTDTDISQKVKKCRKEVENWALHSKLDADVKYSSSIKMKECLGDEAFFEKLHKTCKLKYPTRPKAPPANSHLHCKTCQDDVHAMAHSPLPPPPEPSSSHSQSTEVGTATPATPHSVLFSP